MCVNRDFKAALGLNDPCQICMVVRDLHKTAEYYQKVLGIGPFVFPEIKYDNITYLGQPSEGYWEMAFARFGKMELEFSCPVKSPSIYEDFLNEHGEGLQHLGFDVPDLDATIAQATELGIKVLMSGRTPVGGFAHLDTTEYGGTIFEVFQRPGPRV
ncbi:MAG: VOC family protein [Planctomycetes bacterium]|nr:VOC family protein [Planctomycetota bacterium]